jgi:DNA invertase Pin-like site-specific DNA recombinase
MRFYAAMAQKERELISERTRAPLAAAKARGWALGGDRVSAIDRPRKRRGSPGAAGAVERTAHRLLLEVDRLREASFVSRQALARALTDRGVRTPKRG